MSANDPKRTLAVGLTIGQNARVDYR